jgi:hypothetical protein
MPNVILRCAALSVAVLLSGFAPVTPAVAQSIDIIFTQISPRFGSPQSVTLGSDGAIWCTEIDANAICRNQLGINGGITSFAVPTASAFLPGVAPSGIASGQDGRCGSPSHVPTRSAELRRVVQPLSMNILSLRELNRSESPRGPRSSLVHGTRNEQDRADYRELFADDHRIYASDKCQRSTGHCTRPGRCPVVHRGCGEQDRADHDWSNA